MLEVVLVGELKAGTGQAEFFPWDYCSLFLDSCWLGAKLLQPLEMCNNNSRKSLPGGVMLNTFLGSRCVCQGLIVRLPTKKKNQCSVEEQTQDIILGSVWSMINSTRVLLAVFLSTVCYKPTVHVPSPVETCFSHLVNIVGTSFSESLCSCFPQCFLSCSHPIYYFPRAPPFTSRPSQPVALFLI